MPLRKRNIACLESLWNNKTEDRLNVIPLLDVISKQWGAKVSHFTCNTREELNYDLRLVCKRNYGVLYLAFHGLPGRIRLHKDTLTLSEIAETMKHKFKGWIVHFGSCSTIRSPRAVTNFLETTGATIVTGFTRDVDWIESAALELMLFQNFQKFASPKVACKNLIQKHPGLSESTGFRVFPDLFEENGFRNGR
jgi:hypothetical protein